MNGLIKEERTENIYSSSFFLFLVWYIHLDVLLEAIRYVTSPILCIFTIGHNCKINIRSLLRKENIIISSLVFSHYVTSLMAHVFFPIGHKCNPEKKEVSKWVQK